MRAPGPGRPASGRPRPPLLVVGVALVALLTATTGARAQLFSPGDLAKGHAHLEGLNNCTKCHEAGERLSNTKCLACHDLIKTRVKARTGYHGRLSPSEGCASCHRDHKGRSYSLITWVPSQRAFPHSRTGWPLEGDHGPLSCKTCHEPRRIQDAAVKKRLASKTKEVTFLGLPTDCQDCHFDEHRGQLKQDCARCHVEEGFKKTRGFRHNRDARFKLTGAHRKVRCRSCHPSNDDETTPASAFPPPKSMKFALYKPIAFARCTECHKDPHRGERGQRCESCHTTNDWLQVKESADAGFHQKTRFPLVGEHEAVACKLCHGPFKGEKAATYRGIPFGRCDDCHFDAHGGQLDDVGLQRSFSLLAHLPAHDAGKRPPKRRGKKDDPPAPSKNTGADCGACHHEGGFFPPRFELEDHALTRYVLEGGHQATACRDCHPKKNAVGRAIKRSGGSFRQDTGRSLLISPVSFERTEVVQDCLACHQDPHDGQFAARMPQGGCASCHQVSSFAEIKFDHDKDSRFPLKGAHREADCRRCHRAETSTTSARPDDQKKPDNPRAVVRYRPVEMACASCHTDQHGGQLAGVGGVTACERCHDESGFKKAPLFDHQDPAMTSFALQGKHREVACGACHRPVVMAAFTSPLADPGPAAADPKLPSAVATTAWYRGLPRDCAGCHVDQHEGRFDRYMP